jgi:hypothetical protein
MSMSFGNNGGFGFGLWGRQKGGPFWVGLIMAVTLDLDGLSEFGFHVIFVCVKKEKTIIILF